MVDVLHLTPVNVLMDGLDLVVQFMIVIQLTSVPEMANVLDLMFVSVLKDMWEMIVVF